MQSILTRDLERASVLNVLDVCKALGITIEGLERMSIDNPDEIRMITAQHNEGEDWTNEELGLLEDFKRFIRIRRELHK